MDKIGLPCVMNSKFEDVFTGCDRHFINGYCKTFEDLPNLVHMIQSKAAFDVEITEFKNGYWVHGKFDCLKNRG